VEIITNIPNRPLVGVGVIILKDARILLGKRKNCHGAGTWALPGGHLEFGESLQECAAREVREETGLELVNIRKYDFIDDIFPENNSHYITIFMIAEVLNGEPQNLEPDRCEGWDWFDLHALPENLFRPLQSLIQEEKAGKDASHAVERLWRSK
jgi:8-oxo-dGTP diphosphatase